MTCLIGPIEYCRNVHAPYNQLNCVGDNVQVDCITSTIFILRLTCNYKARDQLIFSSSPACSNLCNLLLDAHRCGDECFCMAEVKSRYYDGNAQSFLLYSVSFDHLGQWLETREKGPYSLLPSPIFRTALPKLLLTIMKDA